MLLVFGLLLVPTGRLELPQLSPPPPQDGVSTNSTTWAVEIPQDSTEVARYFGMSRGLAGGFEVAGGAVTGAGTTGAAFGAVFCGACPLDAGTSLGAAEDAGGVAGTVPMTPPVSDAGRIDSVPV